MKKVPELQPRLLKQEFEMAVIKQEQSLAQGKHENKLVDALKHHFDEEKPKVQVRPLP